MLKTFNFVLKNSKKLSTNGKKNWFSKFTDKVFLFEFVNFTEYIWIFSEYNYIFENNVFLLQKRIQNL